MSHGDQVDDLSDDFESLAATDTCPFAAVRHRSKPIYGLQFHPEVTHTEHGGEILGNFVRQVCGCHGNMADQFVDRARGRGDPRDRGQKPRDLRSFRRRRFLGDGGPLAAGDRAASFRASSWTTASCAKARPRK